jgi:hypothetical protein
VTVCTQRTLLRSLLRYIQRTWQATPARDDARRRDDGACTAVDDAGAAAPANLMRF